MKMVNLVFMTDNAYGGWVTFTVHLAYAFAKMGWGVRIFCLGRFEEKLRSFGYGLQYQNIDIDTACHFARSDFTIITALSHKHFRPELLEAGAYLVLHDPTELKGSVRPEALRGARIITIRKRVHELLASSAYWIPNTFIPHPYVRSRENEFLSPFKNREHAGISLSRIDFDKNILLIGQANKLLDEENKIDMHGFDCRIYSHFKLDKLCPSWRERYHGKYPSEWGSGTELAKHYRYLVDMSTIDGDGDGTQYTFLEGWDAGCVLVVNRGWVREGDGPVQPGKTALAVGDAKELAAIMASRIDYSPLVKAGQEILKHHSPQDIIPQYAALANRSTVTHSALMAREEG